MENKNYFTELNNINVSDKTEKKNGLTYLSIEGVVEPIGKKKCSYQGKMVSVYKIRED